ncbi:hypothetical protein K9O30_01900 [Clostridium bowmanii]|uniref:hypothetical protein n=1 Tax=Clostridium bowmanii TaxID=132925 RepID=UPI001C0ADB28|nr:hypothetical protein [Clostridium bowmanii]MBU3190277.1 hypothetical protein [Clostridium bowmanii]MCA1072511.1 hypothetical protein [Clostridium bowmanii]
MSSTKTNKIIIAVIISLVVIIGIAFSIVRSCNSAVKPPTVPNKIVKHEKMTKEITNEKQVSSSEVYLKADVVVANVTLKENTTKDQAKVIESNMLKS